MHPWRGDSIEVRVTTANAALCRGNRGG